MRQMKLEPIIQSEVSQKEKYKYCNLMHIYGIQKDSTGELISRAAMGKQTQRTDQWTQWDLGRERVRCMERVQKLTIPYVKQIASGNLLLRELKQGLCINPGGGWGRRWEGGLGGREHGYTYGLFLLMFDRKQPNSVKQLSFY